MIVEELCFLSYYKYILATMAESLKHGVSEQKLPLKIDSDEEILPDSGKDTVPTWTSTSTADLIKTLLL
jgi:hypothetical protein